MKGDEKQNRALKPGHHKAVGLGMFANSREANNTNSYSPKSRQLNEFHKAMLMIIPLLLLLFVKKSTGVKSDSTLFHPDYPL